MAQTFDQQLADMGVDITARDVLDDEELEEYCRKQGGHPSDIALKGSSEEDTPPWL
jgi:hypothetical protein